jgi:hypothetical protein
MHTKTKPPKKNLIKKKKNLKEPTNQPNKQTNKSGCEKKHERHTRFAAV